MAERSPVEKGKLAGILIEGESEPAFAVAIGIGVNWPPILTTPPIPRPTSPRWAPGAPDAVFRRCRGAMPRRLAQWKAGGFADIRADWLKRAAGLGETLRVRLPGTATLRPFRTVSMTPDACCWTQAAGVTADHGGRSHSASVSAEQAWASR